ncbi:hypothetical protein E2C01_077394 [Portunus trituberculatus]|uniref:Uncharacterized protein n=1 Tax=Portunus trituberculatus TaxID=210409 RepID=A0A5B7IFY9_PORTR|nr:hypothetical protein [Portunus trituberculatus]
MGTADSRPSHHCHPPRHLTTHHQVYTNIHCSILH